VDVLSQSYLVVPPSLVGVSSGGEVTKAYLRKGRTSNEVIALCKEIEAGLLVVGSRGLGTVRRILICTPPDAQGSILRDCNHIWRVGATPEGHRANKGSICRYNMLDTFSRPLLFEHRERLIGASAWKVLSADYFALLGVRGKAIRTRKKYRN
jgi:hypothetical protein